MAVSLCVTRLRALVRGRHVRAGGRLPGVDNPEGLLRMLYQGPAAAHVDTVETVREENAAPRFTSFRIAGS